MAEQIFYVGVNDSGLDLFEGQYQLPRGLSYNSYLILDEKTAVLDTVDCRKSEEYLARLEEKLQGREPDYLVISHVEPDHASSLRAFLDRYPGVCLIGNVKTWPELGYYFDLADVKTLTVKEGDRLSLGKHELTFLMTPMVHWPEVMMTYESRTKTIFSADVFGTFGILDGSAVTPENWIEEARRYFFNIVGKYSAPVTNALHKMAGLDIRTVSPLHGPLLEGDMLRYAVEKYALWASYAPESDAVLVAWASMHCNTARAAQHMAELLRDRGREVVTVDLARDDMSAALAQAFRCGSMVLAASTMDGSMMPFMADFLHHLRAKTLQKRTVALIENGSWAPMAAKDMRDVLDTMKEINVLEPVVTIRGTMKPENMEAMALLAEKL